MSYGCKCANDDMTPSACQFYSFRTDEFGLIEYGIFTVSFFLRYPSGGTFASDVLVGSDGVMIAV